MSEKHKFQVLAKSKPEIDLFVHVNDCLRILERLRICIPNLPVKDSEVFWRLLRLCIILHDTGKSHREFQRLLRKLANEWHLQRHELFSLVFVNHLDMPEETKELIRFVIIGHHKSLEELSAFCENNYQGSEENELMPDLIGEEKKDFKGECDKLDKEGIMQFLSVYNIPVNHNVGEGHIHQELRSLIRKKLISGNPVFLEYLLMVGAMKHCDHLASAGFSDLQRIALSDFDFLYKYPLYTHQEIASRVLGNVILNAPTGSGKTETAFLWLRKQFEERGQGRVFYVLPYTASINAMYERLQKVFGEGKVGMLHGKIAEYLEFRMSEDDYEQDSDKQKTLLEEYKTLITSIKVVTPFQLLKNLFGLKGFEKGMFEWAGGYFIFDEIHAYDPKVFAQIIVLIRFVTRYLNVRVHVMTATLPGFMRMELEKAIGCFTPVQADDQLREDFTRHRVHLLKGRLGEHLDMIQERLDGGERVLVVCNTVAESQRVYRSLVSDNKVLLHGSFNSEDRFNKEKALKGDDVKLLVGTQAIEVSLDINFSVIFTEPAPLDALIQRFGRVNRKRVKGMTRICDCFVFEERNDADKYIYKNEGVIFRTIEALRKMEEVGVVREVLLQDAIEYVYPSWDEKDKMDYEQTVSLLEYAVLKELSPLKYSQVNEDLFYDQFNGIRVLPIKELGEYQDRLKANKFVRADGLLVPLSENRFVRMLRNEQVSFERTVFESQKTGELYDKSVILIKKKYNKEEGLLIEEEDTEAFEYSSM